MKNLLPILLLPGLLLTGCVIIPDVPIARVVVTDGGPGHCPPGQAKKGRC